MPNLREVFRPSENIRIITRKSYVKLSHPLPKTTTGQNSFSYTGPAIWKTIPKILKKNQKFE